MQKLDIVGGTYMENSIEPHSSELYGSGLRAAAALSNKTFSICFNSLVGRDCKELADYQASSFGFNTKFHEIERTVHFDYYHPLAQPMPVYVPKNKYKNLSLEGDCVLFYGMIEAEFVVHANYLVYDPQNHVPYCETGSSANHLALILNKQEAEMFSTIESTDLIEIGRHLKEKEKADVVVIKNGSKGAVVIDGDQIDIIPVFETLSVWPIGTGDIFSAVFAWQWMLENKSAKDAALVASKSVAEYSQSRHLPIRCDNSFKPREIKPSSKKIYLASPFFTFGERFLVNEIRMILSSFGNTVFSPYHDAGILSDGFTSEEAKHIANVDIAAIESSDTMFAVLSGSDPGTLFEIGYARGIGKRVVIFAENVKDGDLPMFLGSECEITSDLSTALYKASW
nr:PfkB family carbohydrate kinase [Pedobacter panaciterrae]